MEMKLEIGTKLYGTQRIGRTSEVKEFTVTKIGRKYFELNNSPRLKFELSKLTDEHYKQFYFNRQEIEDQREQRRLYDEIYKFFSNFNYKKTPLEKLRQIKSIIDTP